MYLPKSKYKVKHAVWGNFRFKDSPEGEFYVGPYIEDYLGRFYAGKDFATAQKRPLQKVSEEAKKSVKVETTNLLPSEADYKAGSYTRYFRKNKVSKVCEEVTKEQFEQENLVWNAQAINWILVGKLDDYYVGDYLKRGVRHINSVALGFLNMKLPGIVEALELKPEKFVRDE